MSISREENPAKRAALTRVGGLPMINVRQTLGTIIKSFPKKALDFILVFTFITTALGELFGRDYGWKWYALILLILAAFVVKEIVAPEPLEVTGKKEEIKIPDEPTGSDKEA